MARRGGYQRMAGGNKQSHVANDDDTPPSPNPQHNDFSRGMLGPARRRRSSSTQDASHLHTTDITAPRPSYLYRQEGQVMYTYAQLQSATNNFSAHNLIGRGHFGAVYTATFPDGSTAAVKRLETNDTNPNTDTALSEFLTELRVLTRLRHSNLISLHGMCADKPGRVLLVLELCPGGCLARVLYESGESMSWEKRIRVAVGAARGLRYLHREARPGVVHRDVKPSNILLSSNFQAKLGTLGYLAPEYESTGHISFASDVYSFGVVILELMAGRASPDMSRAAAEHRLREWVLERLDTIAGSNNTFVDTRIPPPPADAVRRVAMLAAECLQEDPRVRPDMDDVVKGLEPLVPDHQCNYTYADLMRATDTFSADRLLGHGGFGGVYRATFGNGFTAAVKRLEGGKSGFARGTRDSGDVVQVGLQEFVSELKILSRIRHPNLVNMLGFCVDGNRILLVLELASSGSLSHHLRQIPGLPWEEVRHHATVCASVHTHVYALEHEATNAVPCVQRLKIAFGAASGLAYLHHGMCPPPSNILLDETMTPKISDFGFAKLTGDDSSTLSPSSTSTGGRILGTEGYICPSYRASGHATTASDVYSFGVVLLQLVVGLFHPGIRQTQSLEELVEERFVREPVAVGTLDPGIPERPKEEEVRGVMEVVRECVRADPEKRPNMSQVVQALMKLLPDDLWEEDGYEDDDDELYSASGVHRPMVRWSLDTNGVVRDVHIDEWLAARDSIDSRAMSPPIASPPMHQSVGDSDASTSAAGVFEFALQTARPRRMSLQERVKPAVNSISVTKARKPRRFSL
eukprot:jgi/Chlat1/5761/Chrsp387S05503